MARYAIYVCGGCEPELDTSDCPLNNSHTPTPRGYVAHGEWAEEKLKTHVQKRCPGCGLWKLWVER